MSASRLAKQPEDSAAIEQIHDISQRPQFSGLSGELGVASSQFPIQAKLTIGAAGDRYEQEVEIPNKTGLPDNLKVGVENLSGYSLDDIRVHYNSPKPAPLQALAYTQGTEIHVAPGQEKHLLHEAWHVVQQKQGRVKPTKQMKGEQINEDRILEGEADRMAEKAEEYKQPKTPTKRMGIDGTKTTEANKGRTQHVVSPIIQRWKSETLENEARKQNQQELEKVNKRIAAIRGQALATMREVEDPKRDGDAAIDELWEYISPAEREEYEHLQHVIELERMRKRGIADDIHHILSRTKIESFYQLLETEGQEAYKKIFSREETEVGDNGLNDQKNRNSLFSLRSNLVWGPEGKKRTDDPAHKKKEASPQGKKGESDIDPVYNEDGSLNEISAIYYQVDKKIVEIIGKPKRGKDPLDDEEQKGDISRAKGERQGGTWTNYEEDVNEIMNLLLDAEFALAREQKKDSIWKTRVNKKGEVWTGNKVGEQGESWRKTNKKREDEG
ncbi:MULTISPECIES: DUF4157 domain-containing protein [Cyanophyceae]|uniref:DUF4157 domain-containing protein n=1 Tax=Leptolyngbya subtilissima DQ-A4 TaxID=2933933 RepID=A0ABV0JZI7_9CYAN|nr:DUF4157 domain-containing protein [Nodosilinea sp. FACHB-141]